MYRVYLALGLLLLCGWTHADDTKAMTKAEQQEVMQELEREIEHARQQIDVAARQLANLHKKKYALGGSGNRAMLGVLLDGEDGGLEIVGVTPGGGAAAAGMQAGDRIIEIGGVAMDEASYPRKALGRVMRDVVPGDDVALVYLRDGERVPTTVATQARDVHMIALLDEKLDAKLGEQALDLGDLKIELQELGADITTAIAANPNVDRQMWIQHASTAHALMPVRGELAKYFDVDEGVVVRHVAPDSELQPGDVLLEIAGTSITQLQQAAELLDNLDGEAEVQVQRHGRKRDVLVTPDDFAVAAERGVKQVIRIDSGGGKEVEVNVEVVDD